METHNTLEWSHKLRASLAVILVQAKRLQCDPLKPSQQKRVRSIISESANLLRDVNHIIKNAELNKFPLATSQAVQAKRKSSTANVLLVEDVPVLQKIHSIMLQELGCNVDIVGTGWEALARFNRYYDLVLMDIGLPDQSGVDVTAKIRQLEDKHIPIIMLTSQTGDSIKAACKEAGANEFLNKPVSQDQLGEVINYWLRIHHKQKV